MQAQTPPATQLKRIIVNATRTVACESPDHIHPWGTRRDNSRNRRFNQKINLLFGRERGALWLLDMGCSGGGFVKDCIDDGCVAVGLEGSDHSKRMRRAEWRTIPEFLFTADITAPFEIQAEFESGVFPVQFDVVTCWEVIEHIAEKDLQMVAENVKEHLKPDGLWIMSVSVSDDIVDGVNLHQTVKPYDWWVEKFKSFGLHHLPQYIPYFNTQFVRGPKYLAGGSFHLVLSTNPEKAPHIPKEPFSHRLYDRWLGCAVQRLLRYAIVGL